MLCAYSAALIAAAPPQCDVGPALGLLIFSAMAVVVTSVAFLLLAYFAILEDAFTVSQSVSLLASYLVMGGLPLLVSSLTC